MLFKWLDRKAEQASRKSARSTSRRSFVATLGTAVVGSSALPLLPVWRNNAQASTGSSTGTSEQFQDVAPKNDPGNPESCEYWRYCAIDGFLCSCCGGTKTSCPSGTTMSPITWIVLSNNGVFLNLNAPILDVLSVWLHCLQVKTRYAKTSV